MHTHTHTCNTQSKQIACIAKRLDAYFLFACNLFDVQGCFLVLVSPVYLEGEQYTFGCDVEWNAWRKAQLEELLDDGKGHSLVDEELLLSGLPDSSIRVSPAVCGMDPIRSYSDFAYAETATEKSQLHSRPLLEAWKENLVSEINSNNCLH